MQYLIVIEKTTTGYSAYSPDLDGCVSTGATKQEVEENMREAIEFHLEGCVTEAIAFPRPVHIRPTLTCLSSHWLMTVSRAPSFREISSRQLLYTTPNASPSARR